MEIGNGNTTTIPLTELHPLVVKNIFNCLFTRRLKYHIIIRFRKSMQTAMVNHRITKSYNGLDWKGSQRLVPAPLLWAGLPTTR